MSDKGRIKTIKDAMIVAEYGLKKTRREQKEIKKKYDKLVNQEYRTLQKIRKLELKLEDLKK